VVHTSSLGLFWFVYFYFLIFIVFAQGKITCANVLSDLYAMGVAEVDNMSMIIGVSQKLSDEERDIVIPLIGRGFRVRTPGNI